jgi:hypothetical protein
VAVIDSPSIQRNDVAKASQGLAAAVARAVAAAPPLNQAQRDTLTAAFAGVTPPVLLKLPRTAFEGTDGLA